MLMDQFLTIMNRVPNLHTERHVFLQHASGLSFVHADSLTRSALLPHLAFHLHLQQGPYYGQSMLLILLAPVEHEQSHDQATILLMVPYDTLEEDMLVVIDRNYLIAGVRGQPPTLKGRLYGNIDTTNSIWQLEPRTARLSTRERTTSTTSTTSTQSSYAFVSDPEISSSFAASLESGHVSDAELSPGLSSPALSSDGRAFPLRPRHANTNAATSRSVSPGHVMRSMTSSYSSLDSLHSPHSGRLLTLHLEKEQSVIWPALIVGPVAEQLSPCIMIPAVFDSSQELEHQYNMDPTSLILIGLELFDIRKDKEEAFECFVRAWHQAHIASATIRLVSHYLPLQTTFDFNESEERVPHGTTAYYLQCVGGRSGLAQLYLEAGLLHLEGAASSLLASSYSSLSSIRMPLESQVGEGGTEAWRRDRDAAGRYFERARTLQPTLDVPPLPLDVDVLPRSLGDPEELEMPSIEMQSPPQSVYSEPRYADPDLRRRRKKEEMTLVESREAKIDDIDNTWYLYIPGLVGAGTALLVVGVVGALSISTWSRRNQGS